MRCETGPSPRGVPCSWLLRSRAAEARRALAGGGCERETAAAMSLGVSTAESRPRWSLGLTNTSAGPP